MARRFFLAAVPARTRNCSYQKKRDTSHPYPRAHRFVCALAKVDERAQSVSKPPHSSASGEHVLKNIAIRRSVHASNVLRSK